MKILTLLGLCILCIGYSQAQEEEGRVLSLFNVVRFQNDQCKGSTMNGTCYTKQECKDRGGTESGSCAEGFGVCCLISLDCGGSSHDNNTYLVKSTVTAGTTCSYQICPASSKICRIRYDFTTHTLAANAVGTAVASGSKASLASGNAGAAGNCVSDAFSIANMGGDNPPVICGTNDGQHMILDTDGQNCQDALFTIGSDTHTRKWDIHVTQYTCEEMETSMGAGPTGCLQYHTGTVGHIASFAFPVAASLTGATSKILATTTHLNNQDYKICFRKEHGKVKLCFTDIPAASLGTIDQGTYGVSTSPDSKKAQSGHDGECVTDYLEFSGGVYGGKSSDNGCGSTSATTGACSASTAPKVPTSSVKSKLCGRYFTVSKPTSTTTINTHETVCSLSSPYEIRVHFDGYESHTPPVVSTTTGTHPSIKTCDGTDTSQVYCESEGVPSGTIGFGLIWNQY